MHYKEELRSTLADAEFSRSYVLFDSFPWLPLKLTWSIAPPKNHGWKLEDYFQRLRDMGQLVGGIGLWAPRLRSGAKAQPEVGEIFCWQEDGQICMCEDMYIYIHYMYGICIDMTLDMEILRYDMMRNISA